MKMDTAIKYNKILVEKIISKINENLLLIESIRSDLDESKSQSLNSQRWRKRAKLKIRHTHVMNGSLYRARDCRLRNVRLLNHIMNGSEKKKDKNAIGVECLRLAELGRRLEKIQNGETKFVITKSKHLTQLEKDRNTMGNLRKILREELGFNVYVDIMRRAEDG